MIISRQSLTLFAILPFFTALSAQELQKIGHLSYNAPSTLAGCWHHVDSSGGEWGLIGTSLGLSIVDLADPTQPVERFLVPGATNNWREVRTWAGYAYVGSEAPGSGITIVDLRALPDTIQWKVWRGSGVYDSLVLKSHTVHTADGYLYIFGGASVTAGATIASLNDPWNPEIEGNYTDGYVHDGYVRGNTLWTSEFPNAWVAAVDISDKSNPVRLLTLPTPGGANHNAELNEAGSILFTVGENPSAPLASFDVTDMNDIKLLDTYFPSKKPTGMVHNVRVLGNFLINPSYRGQLTIVDATRPENLIETAWDSLGNSLVWDADPYLPSGIILATAKNEGLFIFKKPSYKHAAWLEGKVIDGANSLPLSNAKVFVLGTLFADTSNNTGNYKTGAADPGAYDVYAFREGYFPKTISGVQLQTNQVTALDITLFSSVETQNVENEPSIEVAPSPFVDHLTVKFPPDSPFSTDKTTLRLFDFSGKMLAEAISHNNNSAVIQGLKHLPAGTYWLMASNENGAQKGVRVMKSKL